LFCHAQRYIGRLEQEKEIRRLFWSDWKIGRTRIEKLGRGLLWVDKVLRLESWKVTMASFRRRRNPKTSASVPLCCGLFLVIPTEEESIGSIVFAMDKSFLFDGIST
jgi:hypothetical protein